MVDNVADLPLADLIDTDGEFYLGINSKQGRVRFPVPRQLPKTPVAQSLAIPTGVVAAAMGNLTTGDGTFMFRSLPIFFAHACKTGGNNFNIRFQFATTTGTAVTVEFGRPTWVQVPTPPGR
jgi:hypothetical protein